jgi:hypothetical protein
MEGISRQPAPALAVGFGHDDFPAKLSVFI